MKSNEYTLILAIGCVSALVSCKKPEPARTEFIMGTVCTVNLYENGTTELYTEVFDRFRELESILSANRDDTNLAAINANAGIAPVKAAPETLAVLSEALSFSEKTGGLFDPTVGPLVKAWNIGSEYAAVPPREKLDRALELVDYRKVSVNADGTVYLEKAGMKLDLGAVAKGYAADEAVRILSEHGIKKAIIDLGGNIFAYGEKQPGTGWTIGIRDPETEQGNSIISLVVSDKSVVTSGVYERYFEENGKKYHHILDTGTGYPADNELLSVSIIASESMLADALSTSTFLLGTEKGLELIERTENTEAIFINRNHEIRTSSGLKGKIKILEASYALAGN